MKLDLRGSDVAGNSKESRNTGVLPILAKCWRENIVILGPSYFDEICSRRLLASTKTSAKNALIGHFVEKVLLPLVGHRSEAKLSKFCLPALIRRLLRCRGR